MFKLQPDYPLGGIKLIESEHCTISRDETVKRTWKERLFTLPWRPWVSTKIITIIEPSPNMYFIGSDTFVGHPVTVARVVSGLIQDFITFSVIKEQG